VVSYPPATDETGTMGREIVSLQSIHSVVVIYRRF
jgi:hypothetical protein